MKRMDNCANLAIVIPAYKIEYLDDCLASIANQTSKNFKLYIGNDNSPHDIEAVVNRYRSRINLEYKKFPENLGSVSLVKHWERSIEMIGAEEWIWLFSDDDMMDTNAVEAFYMMETNPLDIYRFNFNLVDFHGKYLRTVIYEESESVISFLESRLSHKYDNVITNYIFKRETYRKKNGFVDFPLAWGSDDASIIQFAEEGKIKLIPNSMIHWRSSGANITTNIKEDILRQKIKARVSFVHWLYIEKPDLVNKIDNNKELVGKWFLNAMRIEYGWSSIWEKFIMLHKVFAYLGFDIFKLYLLEMKNGMKNNSIKIIKKYLK